MKNLKQQFNEWIDIEMQKVTGNAVAYCINIYEEADGRFDYSIDLVAFDKYDEYDCDWACGCGIFASHIEDTLLYFKLDVEWDECLQQIKELLEDYLKHGKYATAFKNAQAVGYGFVDGDIELL